MRTYTLFVKFVQREIIQDLLLPYVKLVMQENIPQKLVLFQIVFVKIVLQENILQQLGWAHVQIATRENTR